MTPPEHEPEPVLLCPRCDARELRPRTLAGVEIDVCPRCRGAWLDPGELEALTADAVVRAGFASDLVDDGDGDLLGHGSRRARPGWVRGWPR